MSQKKHTPEQIISKLPFGVAQGGEPAEPPRLLGRQAFR